MIEPNVNDMTCGHCASVIARAVRAVDAGSACEVDLRAKTVRITSAQPAQDFIEAIRDAGYNPAASSAEKAS
jgi:copper chaperone